MLETWPVQLNILGEPVVIQWLWSIFDTVSGAIGIGWGPYSPGGHALAHMAQAAMLPLRRLSGADALPQCCLPH